MSTISLLFACSFSMFSVTNWWKNKYFSSSVTTTKHSFILNTFKTQTFIVVDVRFENYWNITGYHIASSTLGQYQVNTVFRLATRAGKTNPSCTFPLWYHARKEELRGVGLTNLEIFWKCFRWSFKSGRRQSKQKKAWTSFVNLLCCKNRSSKFYRSFLIILKLKRNLFCYTINPSLTKLVWSRWQDF